MVFRLSVTYHDLRSVREFQDKTILAVKAPPDTVLTCDAQEVWTLWDIEVSFLMVSLVLRLYYGKNQMSFTETCLPFRGSFFRGFGFVDFTLAPCTSLAVHVDGLCVILLTMG